MKTNTTSKPGPLLRAFFSPLLAIATLFAAPAAAPAQTFYVSNISGNRNTIDKVSSTGTVSLFATLPANSVPEGLAFDGSGNLYVADNGTNQISKITPDGVVSLFATLPAAPLGLAVDSSGNLYAADVNTNQISKITPGGVVSTFAIDINPYGLAFDGSGNLCVADPTTNQISKITPGGVVTLFAILPAGSSPVGLAFDGSGNLYAADTGTNQISKISPDGLTVSTLASISQPTFIAVGLPDLQVTNITTTNNQAPQGSKVTTTATVSNTGNADAGASTTLFLDGTTVIDSANTPAIPAGRSVQVSVDWPTASLKGSHTLEVRADSTNAVVESNETNNSAQLTVTVKGNKVR